MKFQISDRRSGRKLSDWATFPNYMYRLCWNPWFVILERSEGSDSGGSFDYHILRCAPGWQSFDHPPPNFSRANESRAKLKPRWRDHGAVIDVTAARAAMNIDSW